MISEIIRQWSSFIPVAFQRHLIESRQIHSAKRLLRRIARMAVGLRASWESCVKEDSAPCIKNTGSHFLHESLEVYTIKFGSCSIPITRTRRSGQVIAIACGFYPRSPLGTGGPPPVSYRPRPGGSRWLHQTAYTVIGSSRMLVAVG